MGIRAATQNLADVTRLIGDLMALDAGRRAAVAILADAMATREDMIWRAADWGDLAAAIESPEGKADPAGVTRAWVNIATGAVDVDSPVRMADEVRTARPHYALAIWYLLRAWARTSVRG